MSYENYVGDLVMAKNLLKKKFIGKIALIIYKCGGCNRFLTWRLFLGKKIEIRCDHCLDYNIL